MKLSKSLLFIIFFTAITGIFTGEDVYFISTVISVCAYFIVKTLEERL